MIRMRPAGSGFAANSFQAHKSEQSGRMLLPGPEKRQEKTNG